MFGPLFNVDKKLYTATSFFSDDGNYYDVVDENEDDGDGDGNGDGDGTICSHRRRSSLDIGH